ncbi:hypothetical protein [Ornithinimicrobium murale]|uniref:hypothetical protein n=1 Tax=Ornithinimicrobium murale TaxID=1050153 RepID=UPI000E0D32EE|nr:hypothetical protein [Ornithinimicrobium murale]
MSKYEWERGEIKLPTAEFAKVRQRVQDAAAKVKTDAFEQTQSFWKGLSRKEQTDPQAYREALYHWARQVPHGPARDEAWQMLGGHEGMSRPARVQKSDVDFPNSRTTHFRCDEASVSFDRKNSTMTWDVAENNHSVERANESWLAGATFGALADVKWTGKNTGGVLTGNDEYNREADYSGGGASYTTAGFGPIGALQAPSHTSPYTDSKGRKMHGVAKMGRYGIVGKIEPYTPEPRRFAGGYHSSALGGYTAMQGRHAAGSYGGRGGQFASHSANESNVQL